MKKLGFHYCDVSALNKIYDDIESILDDIESILDDIESTEKGLVLFIIIPAIRASVQISVRFVCQIKRKCRTDFDGIC